MQQSVTVKLTIAVVSVLLTLGFLELTLRLAFPQSEMLQGELEYRKGNCERQALFDQFGLGSLVEAQQALVKSMQTPDVLWMPTRPNQCVIESQIRAVHGFSLFQLALFQQQRPQRCRDDRPTAAGMNVLGCQRVQAPLRT